MKISAIQNEPTFGAKFVNNKAFLEVVNYAEKKSMIRELDTALNNLNNANSGDILIIHGRTPNGVYSSFNMNKRSVRNVANISMSPEEASFNAILELGELGQKFKKLVGRDVEYKLTSADLIRKYGSGVK